MLRLVVKIMGLTTVDWFVMKDRIVMSGLFWNGMLWSMVRF